jgi:ubiquinone/menaquinone biosynthesis C-methylase UbiE
MNRLTTFIQNLKSDIYHEILQSERWSACNIDNTKFVFDAVKTILSLNLVGLKVLDIGFGQGESLELFTSEKALVTGICLSEPELIEAQKKGFDVCIMDQSFMTFEDGIFDFIWSRHCLEHSFMPYYSLTEYYRVLKAGGYVYIEVPAPDTPTNQQDNPNHYSVLGQSMWLSLIKRTGFTIIDSAKLRGRLLQTGEEEVYFSFILRKVIS